MKAVNNPSVCYGRLSRVFKAERDVKPHSHQFHLWKLPMPRILWLAFERPPHVDAVCYPATSEDVHLVLELLARPVEIRSAMAIKLRKMLDGQATISPWSRPTVPCRRSNGLYALISWRLAKWLSVVLPAAQGLIERTEQRLRRWLENGTPRPILNATA